MKEIIEWTNFFFLFFVAILTVNVHDVYIWVAKIGYTHLLILLMVQKSG